MAIASKQLFSKQLFLPRLGLCAAGWMVVVLTGCGLYAAELPLSLELPELPSHWRSCFGEVAWLVILPGSDVSVELPAGFTTQPVIAVPKRQHQPVLAFPVLPGVGPALPPAAAVFPLDVSQDHSTIFLRWEQGPAGQLLLRLIRENLEVESLNVPRLCREILERFPTDPWDLDLDRAAAALASGSFRLTDLCSLPSRAVAVPVEPGCWFLESPFFRAIDVPEGGPGDGPASLLVLGEVPFGFHRLFEVRAGWVADMWVSQSEVLWLPGSPEPAPGLGLSSAPNLVAGPRSFPRTSPP